MRRMRSAFTLIELAIVLVVIGLLVGGALVGQSLVRQSAVLNVTVEINKITAAYRQFHTQYNGLPGDLRNASNYFAGAVNGNGNNRIGQYPGGEPTEVFQAPFQLARAGMLDGQYTGTGVTNRQMLPGVNMPVSKLGEDIGYTLVYWGGWTDAYDFTPLGSAGEASVRGHALLFGYSDQGQYETYGRAIRASEASLIDSKADDGKPGTGNYTVVGAGWATECVTGVASATAAYKLSSKEKRACSFIINVDRR